MSSAALCSFVNGGVTSGDVLKTVVSTCGMVPHHAAQEVPSPMLNVEPGDVGAYGRRLGLLSTQAQTASQYVEEHLDVGFGESGIFVTVIAAANDVKSQLGPYFQTLQTVSGAAAAELEGAATLYRTTDDGTAARLDNTY